MDEKKHLPMEQMECFRLYESVATWCWNSVKTWKQFERDTVGKQLVRAIDSVGANLVEGAGRGSDADAARHFVIARASAREARLWISRSQERGLVSVQDGEQQVQVLIRATRLLNGLIKYRRGSSEIPRTREEPARYNVISPEADPWFEGTL